MKALILGGAGFIGSNIIKKFKDQDADVTVVDGLLPQTGARRAHLDRFAGQIHLIEARIQEIDLKALLENTDVVVDCMAWTSHLLAIKDPVYDLELNVLSHLHLIQTLAGMTKKPKVIYLGSRGQYGSDTGDLIDERTAMNPADVQGINKVAADHYFRVYSRLHRLAVVSLRFGNCFGQNQPTSGEDIGLIGGFIRSALKEETIEVFGQKRRRDIVFVRDVTETVYRFAEREFDGYEAYNLSGHDLPIQDLAARIISIAGTGTLVQKPLAGEIEKIDIGSVPMSAEKLKNLLGTIPHTDLNLALTETIDYFRKNLS